MAGSYAARTYATLVGEIAVGWNRIESQMNNIALHYMRKDPPVARFILGALGNVTRGDLIKLLVEQHETHPTAKEHVRHLVSLANRLRENRNILEHGIPRLDYSDRYIGHIYKLDKHGNFRPFHAPMQVLLEQVKATKAARDYARAVRTYIQAVGRDTFWDTVDDGRTIIDVWIAQFGPPPLPDKIDPVVL